MNWEILERSLSNGYWAKWAETSRFSNIFWIWLLWITKYLNKFVSISLSISIHTYIMFNIYGLKIFYLRLSSYVWGHMKTCVLYSSWTFRMEVASGFWFMCLWVADLGWTKNRYQSWQMNRSCRGKASSIHSLTYRYDEGSAKTNRASSFWLSICFSNRELKQLDMNFSQK